jgi:hypothetical protein
MIKSRKIGWVGHAECVGEEVNVYKVLLEKVEGKRQLERPRRGWEDNFNMNLKQ